MNEPTAEVPEFLSMDLDAGVLGNLSPKLRVALYKSKIEELEFKLALLRRSKEENEPSSVLKKFEGLIANVVHLKYYLLKKKENLLGLLEGFEPGKLEKIEKRQELIKTETAMITEYETRLKKIGLSFVVFKLKKERLGLKFEIMAVADKSLIDKTSDNKDIYYSSKK